MQSVQDGKLYKLAAKGEFAKAVGVRLTRGFSGILIDLSLFGVGSFFAAFSNMFRNPFVLIALVIIGAFAPYIITMVYLTLTRQGFAMREGDNVTIKNRLDSVIVPIGSAAVDVLYTVTVSGVDMFKVVRVIAGGKAFRFYTDDLRYFRILTQETAVIPEENKSALKRMIDRSRAAGASSKTAADDGNKYDLPYRHNRKKASALFISYLIIWGAAVIFIIAVCILSQFQESSRGHELDAKGTVLVILIIVVMSSISSIPAVALRLSSKRKYPEYILLDHRQELICTELHSYQRENITNAELYTDRKLRMVLRFMYDFKTVKLILGSTKEGKWYSFSQHREFAEEIQQIIRTDVRE